MNTQDCKIIYEDTDIIVCEKPHGLATQSRRADVPDVETILMNHLCRTGSEKSPATSSHPYLAVIHRLDQPVAGILVFAKTPSAAKELNRQLQQKEFGKYYRALAEGTLSVKQGTLEDYLVKDNRTNTSRVCKRSTPGAKLARLHYHVAGEEMVAGTLRSQLEIQLDTGRHHQIRVQLAHAGCPLVGDTKYNPAAKIKKGWQELKLCAYKLSFRHPRTKELMQFELPSSQA